jgi:hypothetical protein
MSEARKGESASTSIFRTELEVLTVRRIEMKELRYTSSRPRNGDKWMGGVCETSSEKVLLGT